MRSTIQTLPQHFGGPDGGLSSCKLGIGLVSGKKGRGEETLVQTSKVCPDLLCSVDVRGAVQVWLLR